MNLLLQKLATRTIKYDDDNNYKEVRNDSGDQ